MTKKEYNKLLQFMIKNGVHIFYRKGKYEVVQLKKGEESLLYQSDNYSDCVKYTQEVMLFDKYCNSNN